VKRTAIAIATGLGVLAAIYLVFNIGFAAIAAAIVSFGWTGFAVVCCLIGVQIALLSAAWCVLVPGTTFKAWPTFLWGRAVRDSAGDILPLTQLGGFVIGARALALRGVPKTDAYASTVVDVTAEMLAQILFVIVGGVVLFYQLGLHALHSRLLVSLFFGCFLAALGAVGFIILQNRGHAFAETLASRLHPKMGPHADAFARRIRAIYAAPRRVIASVVIHFIAWLGIAFVGWVAVRLIGAHVSYASFVAIESALSAIRSAAVIVPSAIGVQEATYAMLMPLFHVGPEIGVALSLIRRACSVAIGVPVLLSWQGLEGRQALAMRARRAAEH
jgi:putative membrane protein